MNYSIIESSTDVLVVLPGPVSIREIGGAPNKSARWWFSADGLSMVISPLGHPKRPADNSAAPKPNTTSTSNDPIVVPLHGTRMAQSVAFRSYMSRLPLLVQVGLDSLDPCAIEPLRTGLPCN